MTNARQSLRSLVWSDDERRPATPIRFVLATGLLSVVVLALVVVIGAVEATLDGLPAAADPVIQIAFSAAFGLAAILAAVLVDRRTLPDVGLDVDARWWREFAFGLALATALLLGIFAVLFLAGWLEITGTLETRPDAALAGFLPNAVAVLALFLVVGVGEELLVRGYLLTNVAEGLAGIDRIDRGGAVVGAVAVSALAFGALHANNPNASAVSTTGLAAAGILYGVGYALTGRLAIPIGFHIAWNTVEGLVLGFPVSGTLFDATLLGIAVDGPTVATGGAFGPEASVLGLTARVLGIVAIVLYVRRRMGSAAPAESIAAPTLRWREAGEESTMTERSDVAAE